MSTSRSPYHVEIDGSKVDALRSLNIPVYTVGVEIKGFHGVTIDDVGAAATAVQHLLNLGHERVALISGTDDDTMFTVPRDRRAGSELRSALRASPRPGP